MFDLAVGFVEVEHENRGDSQTGCWMAFVYSTSMWARSLHVSCRWQWACGGQNRLQVQWEFYYSLKSVRFYYKNKEGDAPVQETTGQESREFLLLNISSFSIKFNSKAYSSAQCVLGFNKYILGFDTTVVEALCGNSKEMIPTRPTWLIRPSFGYFGSKQTTTVVWVNVRIWASGYLSPKP